MNFEDELRDMFDEASVEGPLDDGSLPAVKARARQRTVRARMATSAAVLAFGVLGGMAVASNWVDDRVDELDTIDDVGNNDPELSEDSAGLDIEDGTTIQVSSGQLSADDFTYVGAFRVPASVPATGGADRFNYGGFAAAVHPDGDPDGVDDFTGSIFLAGFPRNPEVAEISIPEPRLHNGDASDLPVAEFLQPFGDITNGRATTYIGSEDVGGLGEYRIGGLEVFDGRLHWTAWQWFDVGEQDTPGHGHSSLDLANPDPQGPWYLGDFEGYETAGYLFAVPEEFADDALDGRHLISGFQPIASDNAAMSSGSPFFAFSPLDEAPPETRIEDPVALANYEKPEQQADGYREEAVAPGAAWVTAGDGRAAVVTAGNAIRVDGADCTTEEQPSLEEYGPEIHFYDPADLAAVAAGEREANSIAPYASWDLLPHLLPTCAVQATSISVDVEAGRLYVVQPYADNVDSDFSSLPVVHVFEIG